MNLSKEEKNKIGENSLFSWKNIINCFHGISRTFLLIVKKIYDVIKN